MAQASVTRNIIRLGGAAKTPQGKRDAAYERLAEACRKGIEEGMTQSEVARHANVDRQTVRNWIGK